MKNKSQRNSEYKTTITLSWNIHWYKVMQTYMMKSWSKNKMQKWKEKQEQGCKLYTWEAAIELNPSFEILKQKKGEKNKIEGEQQEKRTRLRGGG